MDLLANIRIMVAKSGGYGIQSDEWLPFWMHAIDTSEAADYLCTRYFKNLAELCDVEQEALQKCIRLLGLFHDIGKMTSIFQAKIMRSVPYCRGNFTNQGITISGYEAYRNPGDFDHASGGEVILLQAGFGRSFATIVGSHHGMPADKDVLKRSYIEENASWFYGIQDQKVGWWQSAWQEWIDYAMKRAGIDSVDEIPVFNQRSQMIVCGLVIMADWIASNKSWYPLVSVDEIPDLADYPEDRTDFAMDRLGLPDIWRSTVYYYTYDNFEEEYGFEPNAIQQSVIDIVSDCKEPGVFVVEAPMGSGKTEAAFSIAEVAACKQGKTGLFFGLPTQATANGIFPRVKEWAADKTDYSYLSINLIHSNSRFNPVFQNIPREIPEVDEDSDDGLVVHSFFNGKKQACLADFVVGTVDRLLMSALKNKHVMLLHLGLSQKVVVVDECHAYDAYMSRYLDRALEWLGAYKVPVVLLSATLPSGRRNELIHSYLGMKKPEDIIAEDELSDGYPAITYTDGNMIKQTVVDLHTKDKEITIRYADEPEIKEKVEQVTKAGGCVGIICNTVRKAQHYFEMLSNIDAISEIILYHAQFVISDRAAKEDRIMRTVGKHSKQEERAGKIIIGTQVLEQSLDIDFDFLVTDICPMDLLLQRIGRLQRHERAWRPQTELVPECFIIKDGSKEDFYIDEASQGIYTKWLLYRTKELLPGHIKLPGDIAPLVHRLYDEEMEDAGREDYKEYIDLVEDKRNRAEQSYLLRSPVDKRYRNTMEYLDFSTLKQDSAQQSVRDGSSSLEVLLLVRHEDGSVGFLPWISEGERFYTDQCPESEICKKIASQYIRLPSAFTQEWNIAGTIEYLEQQCSLLTAWQQSSWLRGELVLFLDDDLSGQIITREKTYRVMYSKEKGFIYEREDENGGA